MEKRPLHKDLSIYEQEYKENCSVCAMEHVVYALGNEENCEYLTDVWVPCRQCNGLVHFSLPIN